MYAASLVAGLTLLTGAAAELAILYPNSGATWFTNDTVPLNWTSTQPDIDPKVFRVMLSGPGMAQPAEIAQEVPTANEQYRILLGQVSYGDGFTIAFVNTTNTTQEYAKSEKFKIEGGTPASSSSAAASSTAAASSAAAPPPNVGATAASSSTNPFASSTGTSGAGNIVAPLVAAGALAAAVIAAV